ncbi:PREDICTED: collagen alpha-1(I) chain-like isoform X2 [Calidris pugnax]|nr:PREDICTED: collagen alpha-1(I) chain-like isoform X2 [Calidris pugnax]
MATPEGSRCRWDQIGRSTPNTSPTAPWPSPPSWTGCPLAWPWLWPWGSAALCPSWVPSHSAEPKKGLKCHRAAAQPLLAPVPAGGHQQPPTLLALGANKQEEGEGNRESRDGGLGVPGDGVGPLALGGGWAWVLGPHIFPGGGRASGEGSKVVGPDPAWAEPLPRRGMAGMPGWGGGGAPGFGWQPPSCPCPSRPIPSLRTPGGRAEITGCLPGRGSPPPGQRLRQRAGPGGSHPVAPRALALMASRCGHWPVKSPAVPWSGSCPAWGASGGSARTLFARKRAAGEIVFPQQGGSLRAQLHPAPTRSVRGELWAGVLPRARGETSSPGLSLLLGWECRGVGVVPSSAAGQGDVAPPVGAVPGVRGAGRAGRAPGWAVREEGVGAGERKPRPNLCPLPASASQVPPPPFPPWPRGCHTDPGAGARGARPRGVGSVGPPAAPAPGRQRPSGDITLPRPLPPAAGLPALHAGDEGFHNPAQTGLKRNTQVNK